MSFTSTLTAEEQKPWCYNNEKQRFEVKGCVFKSCTEYNAVMEDFRPAAARAIWSYTCLWLCP